MREHLLEHHKSDLVTCGMESCDNFEHVLETTLQQCILRPLSHYVYLRIEEYYTSNGYLFQVQRSIQQGKLKKQEDFGIRVSALMQNHTHCMYVTWLWDATIEAVNVKSLSLSLSLSPPQKHLVVPSEKAVAEINENFTQMKNTYCAISKLEYLLEAVRLTYENIRDSKNPKKPMNDLGADGKSSLEEEKEVWN